MKTNQQHGTVTPTLSRIKSQSKSSQVEYLTRLRRMEFWQLHEIVMQQIEADALTGDEEKILILLEDETGTLAV